MGGPPPETLLTLEELAAWLSEAMPGRGGDYMTAKAIALLGQSEVVVYGLPRGDDARPLSPTAQVQVSLSFTPSGENDLGIKTYRRIPVMRPERQHHLEAFASQHPELYAIRKSDAAILFGWQPAAAAGPAAAPAPDEGADTHKEQNAPVPPPVPAPEAAPVPPAPPPRALNAAQMQARLAEIVETEKFAIKKKPPGRGAAWPEGSEKTGDLLLEQFEKLREAEPDFAVSFVVEALALHWGMTSGNVKHYRFQAAARRAAREEPQKAETAKKEQPR